MIDKNLIDRQLRELLPSTLKPLKELIDSQEKTLAQLDGKIKQNKDKFSDEQKKEYDDVMSNLEEQKNKLNELKDKK